MSKNNLKYLIEQIINEELSVDSPQGGPLGKVAFANFRTDKVEPEENTEIEDEIFKALYGHIDDNNSADLAKVFNIIYDIAQTKKYKLLTPEPGFVYRIIFGVSLEKASQMLQLPIEQINNADKSTYTKTNGILETTKSSKFGIQSWTSEPIPEILKRFGSVGSGILSDDTPIVILARAKVPTSGKFILNPQFTKKIKGLNYFSDEAEVVSGGPVTLTDASFIRFVPDVNKKVFTIEDNETFQQFFDSIKNNQAPDVVFKLLSEKLQELLKSRTNLDINRYSLGSIIKYNTKTKDLNMDLSQITYGYLIEHGVVETLINKDLTKDLLGAIKNGK